MKKFIIFFFLIFPLQIIFSQNQIKQEIKTGILNGPSSLCKVSVLLDPLMCHGVPPGKWYQWLSYVEKALCFWGLRVGMEK